MKYAYVTVLSTNNYYEGVVALFESLKLTNPKYTEFVVVANETVDKSILDALSNRGYKIIIKNRIQATFIKNEIYKHWSNTFDKFNIFDLTEYDKIVYLDSDMYISQNIDELFDMRDMSATVAGKTYYKEWNEINSGLMVIVPKKGILEGLIEALNSGHFTKSVGDQNVIDYYFDWHNKKELEISEKYNLFAFLIDYYFKHYDYNREMVKVIHFIGSQKPWMMTEEEINNHRNKLISEEKPNELYYFDKYIEILNKKDTL